MLVVYDKIGLKYNQFMLPVFPKKLSWIILTSFFVFDDIVSYWAIAYRHAHEANPIIASTVEKYPLLYFLCIPGIIIIMYLLSKIIINFTQRIFKSINNNTIEKVVLTTLVFYWAIANSSINFLFLIGHKQSSQTWYFLAIVTILPAIIYTLFVLIKQSKQMIKS